MEIRLLGLVEASHDGRAVPLGGAKPRALLAMLALHANAPVSADRLIEGLWGERPPATASKLVQVLVSQLRKQLAGSDAEIVTRGRGYELRVDPDAVDALRFERLLMSGENGSHCAEALALWRGPPLDDLADEPFAAPEIRRLEDLWLEAREAAIDAALADGRHAAVLGELDELVRAHPLRERLHGQRMLALYRCGRQAEALEAFRDARQRAARRGRARAGPGAAPPQRRDPPPGPGARRSAGAPVPGPRRGGGTGWLFAAAAVAIAAAVVLAVTQLARLGRARPASPRTRPASSTRRAGEIVPQYAVGHAPDALAAGAGSVWSANGLDGTVSRVDRGRWSGDDDRRRRRADRGRVRRRLAVGRGRPGPRVEQVDSAHEPRRPPPAGGQRAARRGGRERRRVAQPRRSTGRWSASISRTGGRIQRIDVPGGPGRDRRGRRRRVGGRRGGRRRDQARSPLGRGAARRSGSATGRPRSPSATAGSGSPTATTARSRGSTRRPTRSATRCASAAARSRSPPESARSGWPTAPRAP